MIRGFSVIRAIEITEQEVLSSIERDLIEKESIVSTERFQTLQQKLRALLRRPEIELGIAAIEGDRVLILNFGSRFEHSCIFADSMHARLGDFAGSLYERAALERQPVFVEDLESLSEPLARGRRHAGRRLPERGGGPSRVPESDHRQPEGRVAQAQLAQRGIHAAAAPDPAAVRHGRPAQHGRAEQPHPGGDQGEVHGHSPRGGMALPQGRAQQHREARAHGRGGDGRDGAHRLPGRPPALCAGGHPGLVYPPGVVDPGRPPEPARAGPRTSWKPRIGCAPWPFSTSSATRWRRRPRPSR